MLGTYSLLCAAYCRSVWLFGFWYFTHLGILWLWCHGEDKKYINAEVGWGWCSCPSATPFFAVAALESWDWCPVMNQSDSSVVNMVTCHSTGASPRSRSPQGHHCSKTLCSSGKWDGVSSQKPPHLHSASSVEAVVRLKCDYFIFLYIISSGILQMFQIVSTSNV